MNIEKIQSFIDNKDFYIEKLKNIELTYENLCHIAAQVILGEDYDEERLHSIDNGDYRGTIVFVFQDNSYQHDESETYITWVYYGSCCGCDTLQSIITTMDCNEYAYEDLLILILHLLQKCRLLSEAKPCFELTEKNIQDIEELIKKR